jgi:hypothetical protein
MAKSKSKPKKWWSNKTSKQKTTLLSWMFVMVVTSMLLIWIFVVETQYDERFLETKMADKGTIFIDLRLKEIEQLGGKTLVASKLSASAKGIKDPKWLNAIVHSKKFKRENNYKLTGQYDHTRMHFLGKNEKVHLTPGFGSPSWYPFDNLSFEMTIDIQPATDVNIPDPPFGKVHLYQALEGGGYVFVNPEFSVITEGDSNKAKLYIKFRLARKLFAKIAFVVYAAFVVLYVVMIVRYAKSFQTLITSLVGFFISIWSLRQGLNSFSEGHTTLVDHFFLFVPLVLLLHIFAKLVTGQFDIEEQTTDVSIDSSDKKS